MKFATKTIHAGIEPDPSTGAVMTPIYQTSTYAQAAPGDHQGYEYARTQNPTRHALEANLAALENGADGICFGSGLAAMDAILKLLDAGDEIVATNDLYGGSYRLITKIYERFGMKGHFVPMYDASQFEQYLTPKTKLIWIETPTNPMLNIVDIEAICAIAKKRGILTAVDNTFATPYLQNPLDLGADMVIHSATKYLGGHSDTVLGAVVTKTDELAQRLHFIQNSSGGVPGPMDCFLVLRGIKTLHLRVQRACENAEKIAHALLGNPKINKVYYPGFADHPGHELAKKQMSLFGAMVSFDLKEDTIENANKILTKTKLFTLAESLGGVESLIGHPSTMTHASIPRAERLKVGLTDSLIRLSVGVEDVDDLLADLQMAM
ncbi:MAG: cystathionine gamma-synthase [Saprospiraceae bacterium]|nr:cystathionine gamma-synthase [Saprospiraceae bacterium]MCF8249394.1 cystathionine gamma-synthase [Saprospiraceae bacterium]MCF8279048.1 cystathionine gamma-synthase [Bacteroidales bacterium]MCF8311523.1 cystathionine gamma-synthase [Saprospiraceae bacterium]MCF8440013.1 cystathionine gamma-synthase [Saprospiraceae bacterium]